MICARSVARAEYLRMAGVGFSSKSVAGGIDPFPTKMRLGQRAAGGKLSHCCGACHRGRLRLVLRLHPQKVQREQEALA